MSTDTTSVRTTNPYVGPRSFRAGDALHGRAQARDELLDLVIAERIVLLYSPSGAGKTSLIQAALVSALEDANFEVLPVVRVTHALGADSAVSTPHNRYVMGTLLSLEEGVPPELQRPVAELARMTLSEYLRHRPDLDGRPGNEVLIFDQFEEVLTADPTDEDAKREFFVQLGAMLRERQRNQDGADDSQHEHWALFAMREDFLAALDPYLRYIPTRFRTRYRLDLLTADQALEAAARPAREAGIPFAPGAAERLIDDLRRVRVQRANGTHEVLGPYIEPVQLQVACHLLWSRLAPDARAIDSADGTALGDVEDALAGYYASRVASAAQAAGVREGLVRDWFEQRLITPQGLRGQVLDGPLEDEEADRELLRELVSAHLVRAESRRQATWYELAHDRFIEPVKRDNAGWRAEHLTPFERAAMLWDADKRPDRLLLLGPSLRQAEQELSDRSDPLSRREADFLEASRRADERHVRDLRNAARMRRLVRALAAACVVALVLLASALVLWQQAEAATERAEAQQETRRLLFQAQRNLYLNPEASVILGAALPDASGSGSGSGSEELTEDVRSVMYLVAAATPVTAVLPGQDPPATAAALSDDGTTAVTGGPGGIVVWDRSTQALSAELTDLEGEVLAVDVSRDGSTVAAALEDGRVMTWHPASDDTPRTWEAGTGDVWSVALTPDGTRVASVSDGDPVRVWDVDGDLAVPVAGTTADGPLEVTDRGSQAYSAVFSTDGTLLATVGDGEAAVVWDAETGEERRRMELGQAAWGVLFDPEGTRLATVDLDRTIRVWSVASGELLHELADGDGATYRSVSRDLTRALSMMSWGEVSVYDIATGTEVAGSYVPGAELTAAGFDPVDPDQVLVLPSTGAPSIWRTVAVQDSTAVSVTRDGTIFTALNDGRVLVTEADGRRNVIAFTEGDTGTITTMEAHPDGRRLAVVTGHGDAHIWDVVTGELLVDVEEGGRWLVDVTFTADGSELLTADNDGRVTRWDASTGEELDDLVPQLAGSPLLQASPDGSEVLVVQPADSAAPDPSPATASIVPSAGSGATTELLLDAADELGPSAAVTHAAFSPDGRRVALGTGLGGVAVLDTSTGELEWSDTLHLGFLTALHFTPDGHLLSAGADNQVRLTDESGGSLREVPFSDFISTATLSDDGDEVVAYLGSGSVVALPLDDADLVDLVRSRVTRDLDAGECEQFRLESC